MKATITIMLALGIVGVAAAYDLGNRAPVKPVVTYPENIPNPERQGGDTIETAFLIPSLPFNDTGTTTGYNNDYDEACPYTGSTAPDVVYTYVPAAEILAIDIDLCHSSYDTKVYVYDGSLDLVACNDDYSAGSPCFQYSSKLEDVYLTAGRTYYIVVDGYESAAGTYVLDVTEADICVVDCPTGWHIHEGEPPLVDDYVDNYNGGCYSPPDYLFQEIRSNNEGGNVICGVSGWYDFHGSSYRDTDWFVMFMGPSGSIEVTADAEVATYIFELGPQDCSNVGVIQLATAGPCQEAFMTIGGYAMGAMVWLWVGPTTFTPPDGGGNTYDYVVWVDGLEPCCPPTGVPIDESVPENGKVSLGVYPTPFNPRTTVNFVLPATGRAMLAIYDAKGQMVTRLVDETLAAGSHHVDWLGTDSAGRQVPSGTYFCRLTTPWGVETRKLALIR